MNQKASEFFSKVEEKYGIKLQRVTRCPICGQPGGQLEGNSLIMEHRVDNLNKIVYHRWSYSTGRLVEHEPQDTNVI